MSVPEVDGDVEEVVEDAIGGQSTAPAGGPAERGQVEGGVTATSRGPTGRSYSAAPRHETGGNTVTQTLSNTTD